jgi:menaquinone-specific isochorismate synthase
MKYSIISEQLQKFLSSKEIIRQVKVSSRIISFAVPVPPDFSPDTDHLIKTCKNLFYFNTVKHNFSYYAVGVLTSIIENGDGRYSAIDKKVRAFQYKIITNWDKSDIRVPLFTGGMKFMVEHNDTDWKDFNDSNWIIPEIIFLADKGDNYIVYNFYYTRSSDIEEIMQDFEKKLQELLTPPESNGNILLKVLSSTGNAPKDKKKWKNMVNKALDKIYERGVKKIVLSRKVELILNSEPVFGNIIKQLERNYAGCGIFLFKNNNSVFFGATPERLAVFNSNHLTIDALAGSSGNENADAELFSDKNIKEHDFVIEHIRNSVSRFSDKTELTRYHNTKKLNNISHIWSEISAEMKEGKPVFLIIKELFPTPAICGTPKEAALELIKKLEDHRRGLYSGIIGWFNFSDAEFYVSIRSALCTGKKIIAYAGCGIVNGSDPDEEFTETELKLIPILSLFKNENKNQPEYHLD